MNNKTNLIVFLTLLFSYSSFSQVEFQTLTPLESIDISDLNFNEITSADLDADGDIDIVTITDEGTVLFMNSGNGAYEMNRLDTSPPSWFTPRRVFVVDFDQDGDLDILNCNYTAWYVNLYTNDGNGNFTRDNIIDNNNSTGVDDMVDFVVNDFDQDGDYDFVCVMDSNAKNIYWIENHGNGTYTSHQIGIDADFMAHPFDFEGDGDLDVMVVYYPGVKVLVNDGNMNFTETDLGMTSYGIGATKADDIDDDGDLDFLLGKNFTGPNALFDIIENNGNGNFTQHTITTNYAEGIYVDVNDIDLMDMDSDGDKDIVCAINNTDGMLWFENQGNLNYSNYTIPSPLFNQVDEFYLGDLDSDGFSDWTYYSEEKEQLLIYNPITSDFSIMDDYSFNPTQALDMDNDGLTDLIGIYNNTLVWSKNLDGFSFDTRILTDNIYLSSGTAILIKDYKFGDMNNDGMVDIVAKGSEGTAEDQIMWLEWQGGTNYIEHLIPNNIPFEFAYNSIDLFDINNDGNLDIFLARDDRLVCLTNDGAGNFQEHYIITPGTGYELKGWDYGDINGDGTNEIVIMHPLGLYLYEQDGPMNFTEIYHYPFPEEVNFPEYDNVRIDDINNNGLGDIVCGEQNLGFFWLDNQGDNLFFYRFIGDSDGPFHSYDLDLDNDGDLIQYNTIFENSGNGLLSNYPIQDNVPFVSGQSRKVFLDIDNDQDLDYIVKKDATTLVIKQNLAIRSVVEGFAYWDENGSQSFEPNEYKLPGVLVESQPGGLNAVTDSQGDFYLNLTANDYQISSQAPEGWALASIPTSFDVTLDNQGQSGIAFGFVPTDSIYEIEPYIATGIIRCNNSTIFHFNARNNGTLIGEGELWASLDPNAVDSITFIDEPDIFIDSLNFGWYFNGLYPNETTQRNVMVHISGITDLLSVGDTLDFGAELINSSSNDTTDFIYEPILLCSYDPNDKLVVPSNRGIPNYTFFDEELIYTIRFQNTGNDTAFQVLIKDYLDEYLDPSTLTILASSHIEQLTTDIYTATNQPLVSFYFEDIMLPDSTTNPIGSQGFVMFSILPKSNMPEGYQTHNQAEIYFDLNPAIITNTTLNTFVSEIPCEILQESTEACDSVQVNGIWYFESGIVESVVFTEPYACERTITTITINNSTTIYEEIPLLNDQTHTLPDGTVVDQAGEYYTESLDANGCAIYTYTTIEFFTGVNEMMKEWGVNIYPNPVGNQLVLELDGQMTFRIRIFNALGLEMLQESVRETQSIDTESWMQGMYYMEIMDDTGRRIAYPFVKL